MKRVTFKRLISELKKLEQDPFPKDVKRVVSKTGKTAYRVRVGSWRIEYVVFYDKKELLVYKIDKRPKSY